MNFQKICFFAVFLIVLVSVGVSGCVRVIVNSKGFAAPEAPPYPEQSAIVHKISHLSRFESIECEIKKNEVEEILNYASLVARCGKDNNDDPLCAPEFTDMHNDFGCKISFELNTLPIQQFVDPIVDPNWPPIFTFPDITGLSEEDPLNCLADGVICSQGDLEKVWGVTPPNDGIKIVRDILFCENTTTPYGWVGCAQFPETGQAIAITRLPETDLKLEGILWLHEYGHTKGLRHITKPKALNRDPNAVMAPDVSHSRTKLNRKECFRLRDGFL
jgi:hypothetical protein